MNLQLLLETYLEKRQQADELQKEIDQVAEAILDNPDFGKEEIVDWCKIERWSKTSKVLMEDAEIPDTYKYEVFDHNWMIKKEPTLRNRIQRWLMNEYQEYVVEWVDTGKLLEDMPELFQNKTTTFLKLTRPK